ncbi:MAG: sugar phosphate isomerase/epimerase [Bryobacteraceae bacterium]
MADWTIGLSTGCCWKAGIFECLEDIRDCGFDLIEICSHPGHLDYHDLPLVRRAASLIRSLGLEAHSFHAPFAERIDITSLEEDARAAARQELMRAAEAAAILEAKYFVVHPGPEKTAFPERERFARLGNAADVLDQVYHHSGNLGVNLVLENMLPHLFAGRIENLLWIMETLKGRGVGICVDTGHGYLGCNLPEIVQLSAGHLRLVHASDNRGHRDDHLAPGDGGIDWSILLRQLLDVGYDGALILEIAELEDRRLTLEAASRGREYLCDCAQALESRIWPKLGDKLQVGERYPARS